MKPTFTTWISFFGLSLFFCCLSLSAQGVISIDPQSQRYIGKESSFDRSKYLTFHTWFKKEDADFERFKAEYYIDPAYNGSRLFNSPVKRHKHGTFPPVKDTYDGVREVKEYVSTGHPHHFFYDDTVDYSDTDVSAFSRQAAAYAASYFKDEAKDVPRYYEPFNEPMIKAVTFYPQGKQKKYIKEKINAITTKMCEFHRDVAQEIHATPELQHMLVGGFGSAFPEFEAKDFDLWNNRYRKFIDIAGKEVDFYTVHLYDGSGVNNKDGRRSGSNSEAILDLIEAYSFIALGELKPYAITEYGRLVPDQPDYKTKGNYVPLVNAQAVRSQMHMVMNFIERGDLLLLSTPFTIGKAKPKARYAKSSLWTYTGDKTYELSQRKYFFEVWKDVKGERVSVTSSNIDVQAQGFVSGKELYVVLNNLNDQTQQIDLQLLNTRGLRKVSIKQLNIYEDKLPRLSLEQHKKAPQTLAINYGETIVLTYEFKAPISFSKQIHSQKYYATTYLQPIRSEKKLGFTINQVEVGPGRAILRLGLGRDHDSSLSPTIWLNGRPVSLVGDLIRGYDQKSRKRFFGTLEIPVPMEYLKTGTNQVELSFPDQGGHVSSVILQVDREETLPRN